jgi:hypothetical protein
MLKKLLLGNGVKDSSGFIVRRGSLYSIRYSDNFIDAEVRCEYRFAPESGEETGFWVKLKQMVMSEKLAGVTIWPETLKVMKKGGYIEISSEAQKIVHQRIKEGMEFLGAAVEMKPGLVD